MRGIMAAKPELLLDAGDAISPRVAAKFTAACHALKTGGPQPDPVRPFYQCSCGIFRFRLL
jgi:hypothetical protein